MLTTTANTKTAAPRMALRQSIARYAAGEFSRRDIEKVFASTLDQNPGAGEVIREYLDQQLHDRAISKSVYKDLLEQLGSHLPEDVPTESAEQPPASLAAVNPATPPQVPVVKPQVAVAAAKGTASVQLGPGTILRERFRLDEAVASGSMGLVFRATDLLKLEAGAISPVIAIKVINPEFANDAAALRSFQNEVANTQHLSHPNIIRLFELDKDQGHYFITMEWLEGESLDALLDRSRGSALPPVQAYAIIEQLCDALDYAHGKQVIHADVKPGNVFLTKPGELKLIDFGIARIHSPFDEAGTNREKSVALTPAYASCECLEHQTATAQDDLFSLACLIYRLLSGRRVFGARTALQAEAEGIEPVAIGGMSARRWQALRKALAFRRADRQPEVRIFAEEFAQGKEARSKFAPEPDDTPYTDTTNLEFNIDDFQEDLNDTGFLGVLKTPEDTEQDFYDDNFLDNLNAPIDQEIESAGSARRSDKVAASSEWERKAGKAGKSKPKSLLNDESLAATETRLPTESTVPNERAGTGTIEIELLREPALSVADSASQSADSPASEEPVTGSASSATPAKSAASGKAQSAPAAPVYSPAVRPAAPKATTKARSPVVQKLTAPDTTEASPATVMRLAERVIAQPRYLAVAASVVLVLGAVLLGGLMGGADPKTVPAKPLSADGIVAAVPPIEALSDRANAVAPAVVAESHQRSVTLGDPVVAESPADPEAAGSDGAKLSSVTADAGLAAQAAAASVSPGRLGNSPGSAAGKEASAVATSAADSGAVATGDFNPNGPVPFSALQLDRYVAPEFPAAYADQRIEGWVDVKLAIASDGSIESVELIDTELPPDFLPPSRAAVSQWRFKPFVWNGIAIAASTTVRLTYSN